MGMISSLYQGETWTTNDSETLAIEKMNSKHIKNVLGWLWRNRESLKLSAEAEMAFSPKPSSEAASDAYDQAFEHLLEMSASEWVRSLPVCEAMAQQLETRGEPQEFWMPTLIPSPSGASMTCRFCGTIYDNHPNVGEVPPVGDGCERCSDD